MKNLKRALAVVIALTMVMSSVAFAATFSDVTADAANAEAINLGVALNLYTGYEDGSFKPEGDITRAEFAAIVVRMLGQESQADGAKGTTAFTDVASDNWAAGYVNIASNQKIVNGYGDGKFGPEDKVTYEQAVKMIVVALGYEQAVGAAGYPVGYLTIAQQKGITTGVKGTNGVAINRGQVAQLVFNSLDVPLMEQTGFGTYIDYVVQDGSGDTYEKTLMSEKLSVVKLKAFVNKTYDLESSKKNDLVSIDVKNSYGSKYDDTDDYADSETFENQRNLDINIGKTNLKNFVGTQVTLYIAYDENSDDDPIALFVKKYVSTSDEVTFNSDDLDVVTASAYNYTTATPPVLIGPKADSILTVDYYETATATKTTDLTVANNADVYVNGYDNDISVADALSDFYGSVTFSLEDDATEEDFDTVFITDYQNMVVDEVNTSTGKVLGKEGVSSVIFKDTNTDNTSTLVDKDNNTVEWSSLKENDVLSIKRVTSSGKTVNVCTLIQNVITGSITEVSGDVEDDDDAEFTIGGNSYKVDGQIQFADTLRLEDEGDFYLDIMGRIAYVDTKSTLTNNYAYVLNAKPNGTIDTNTQIKMFTYAGEVVTLDTASKVKVSYVKSTTVNGITTKSYTSDSVDTDVLVTGTKASNPYKLEPNDFITFGVNSSGKISKISFTDTLAEGDNDVKNFTRYVGPATASYDKDKESFDINGTKVYVTDATIIMQAPATTGTIETPVYDEDNYELIALSALTDDYTGWSYVSAYDVNEDREADVILVQSDVVLDSKANGVAMVVKTSSAKNPDGDTVDKATVLQNANKNDLKSIDVLAVEGKTLSLNLADVIVTNCNGKGEITNYTKIAVLDGSSVVAPETTITEGTVSTTKTNIQWINEKTADEVIFTLGKVTARKSGKITVDDLSQDGIQSDDFIIPTDANVYVYDSHGSKAINQVIAPEDRYDAFSIDKSGTIYDSDNDTLTSVYVLVREYEDEVVDVIFYLF